MTVGLKIGNKGDAEYEGTRLFGDPAVPESWAMDEPWSEDCYFLGQINLEDIKSMDHRLPNEGYIYFFTDTSTDLPEIRVFYTDEEIDTIYEDCNMGFDEIEYDIFSDYVIDFDPSKTDGSVLCQDDGDETLLIRICPKEFNPELFDGLDISVYIKNTELASLDFSKVTTRYV